MQGGDCVQPAGTLHESTDCDDGDDSAHPDVGCELSGNLDLALVTTRFDSDITSTWTDLGRAVTAGAFDGDGHPDLVSSALDAAGTDAAALILGVL